MGKLHIGAVIVSGLIGAASPASATLYLREPFNYAAGQTLDAQAAPNGETWDNRGADINADRVMTAAGNLAYAPIGPSEGGSVTYAGFGNTSAVELFTGADINNGIDSGTVYYSMLFRITDFSRLGVAGGFFAALNNNGGDQTSNISGTSAGARILVRPEGSGYVIGTERNSSTPDNFVFDDHIFSTSDVVFVVASYTFLAGGSAGAGNDEIRLWINPDTLADEAAPDITITTANGTDLTRIPSVALRQNASTNVPGVIVDELRVASTWAEAAPVPEPVGTGLVLIGSGLLAVRRRR